MSSSTPATNTDAHASTAAARAQSHLARRSAAPQGGDLFASLLTLLSSAQEAPAGIAAGGAHGSAESSADGREPHGPAQAPDATGHHPLAALLGWPGALPQSPGPVPGASAAAATPGAQHPSAPTARAAGATAAPAEGAPGTGLPLSGMTVLETPVAPDASLQAALGRADPGEAAKPSAKGLASSATQPLGSATAAARATAWRAPQGLTPVTVQPPQGGPTASGDKGPSAPPAWMVQTRSTVALAERLGPAPVSETSATGVGGPAPVAPAAGAQAGAGHGSSGAASDPNTPHAAAERTAGPDTDTPPADATPNPAARETEEGAEVHWGASSLRHASLRVGEAGEDAIDIQLALTGQELRVDFRTDNADARASLAQDARESLGDLLQRSGIQLGSVSVGAQGQQQGGHAHAPAAAPHSPRGRAGSDSDATPAAAPVGPRPRSDGSQPLDLFV